MKYLALIFVFSLAAATTLQDVWEHERSQTVSEFTKGMKMAGPLRVAMGVPNASELDEIEDGIKDALGEEIKEIFDQIIQKIKDAIERGKNAHNDLIHAARKMIERLSQLHITTGGKTKDTMKEAKNWLKTLLDKLLRDEKHSTQQMMEVAGAFNLERTISKVLEKLKEKIDVDTIRQYIQDKSKKIQEMANVIIDFFNEGNGRQEVIDLVESLLQRTSKRSLKESWEELKQRLKDFFKDKHLQFKEKYSAFFEWLIESIKNGLEITKDKIQALKNIARELIKYSKEVSKEVAIEAVDALRPYKGELGEVWDQLRKKVKEILHRDY